MTLLPSEKSKFQGPGDLQTPETLSTESNPEWHPHLYDPTNPEKEKYLNLKNEFKFKLNIWHTFEIDANLGAIVLERGALVDVLANLWILLGSDVASIARTDVAATSQVLTAVLASAVAGIGARAGRVAAALVRLVLAVVLQVADQFLRHAVAVGARKLLVGIARLGPLGAERHVVLVRAVLAVVVAVANLPAQNAPAVVALEPIPTTTLVGALFRFLVRIVSAVVDAVTAIFNVDANVIVAFKTFRRAVFSV